MEESTTRYIVEYFKGEQRESYLFIAAGCLAMIGAYYGFVVVQSQLFLGIAVPLAVMGLIELIVGISMATKTNKQIRTVLELRKSNPEEFKSQEVARMENALKHFNTFRLIEQVLFIVGLLLVVLGCTNQASMYWTGVGVGLMVQASIMLFLDLFAELRAKEYVRRLSKE